MGRLIGTATMMALLVATVAHAATRPRYDVPAGFTRCPHAIAWNGFFKWASQHGSTCRTASDFMRAYAARAGGSRMPRHVDGYACRIYYWRDGEGDVYASRHTCSRSDRTIRFYGMV